MATSSKRQVRQRANDFALEALRQVRHMVNPMPDEQKLKHARLCQKQLNAAITMLAALEEPPEGISDRVQPQVEDDMQKLAEALQEMLAPLGFALLVFEFGEEATMNYISNAHRTDMLNVMREFIAKHEGA